jgi:hypothetical protein
MFVCAVTTAVQGYGGFKFPSFLQPPPVLAQSSSSKIAKKRIELIEAISFTGNGKNASPEKQAQVLGIVRDLETLAEPSANLLTDASLAKQLLDGVWYLQWTCPCTVGENDQFPNEWKPDFASEDGQVEVKKFDAKGTVVAAGLTVGTSNRVVKQIFDIDNSIVANEIMLDFGVVRVSGNYRPSENVPRRAIVSFNNLDIEFQSSGMQLKLGWIFSLLSMAKGTDVGGWLETTYVDDAIRIGKGNKGTCFVLTRNLDAVAP